MFKNLLNGIVIMLLATSCKANFPITETQNREIIHKIIERDTVVVLPADSALIIYRVEVDDNKQIHLTEINTQVGKTVSVPELSYNNGLLTIKNHKPPEQVTLTIKDNYTFDNLKITQIERIETNRLTWWQTTQIWIGKICGLLVLSYVGLLVLRLRAWI